MIIDKLENAECYFGAIPYGKEAFAFIRKCAAEKIESGDYEIDGLDGYAFVIKYDPRDRENPRYETHERYIDIQCLLRGSEYHWYVERSALSAPTPYDMEKDITFYSDSGKGCKLHLTQGCFAVYFPQDGHLPTQFDGVSKECVRVIVKINCSSD